VYLLAGAIGLLSGVSAKKILFPSAPQKLMQRPHRQSYRMKVGEPLKAYLPTGEKIRDANIASRIYFSTMTRQIERTIRQFTIHIKPCIINLKKRGKNEKFLLLNSIHSFDCNIFSKCFTFSNIWRLPI
jgi:hypothetical protein